MLANEQDPKDERALARFRFTRAEILLGLDRLTHACEDIEASLRWHEAERPRNGRSLGMCYGVRGHIFLKLGMTSRKAGDGHSAATYLKRAQADIHRAITLCQRHIPEDSRTQKGLQDLLNRIQFMTQQ